MRGSVVSQSETVKYGLIDTGGAITEVSTGGDKEAIAY
jgi:hypothetical protein